MKFCPSPSRFTGPSLSPLKRGERLTSLSPRASGVRGLLLAAMLTVLPTFALGETIPEQVALLQGLDKITARVSKFEAQVDTPALFGTLSIRVRDCEKNPPEETPESAAFVEIDEMRSGQSSNRLFSGWMFASSPALSALEHPVYDIILLDCRAATGSPRTASGKATGKEAR